MRPPFPFHRNGLFPRSIRTGLVFAGWLAAAPAMAGNVLQNYDFEVAGNAQGWTPANTSMVVSGGVLQGTATTADPQLANNVTDFSGSASGGVLIRYRGNTNDNVKLFWGRSGADNYSESRAVTLNYSGVGEWRTLYLNPADHPEWAGQTITRLRFDPAGSTGSTFDIDWLRVLSWDYDGDGWRDADEGAGDTDGDGLMDMEDPDSNNDGLTDAWEKAIGNAPGSVHFNFDGTDAQGWAAAGGLTLQGVAGGRVEAEVTGPDPQFVRGRLHLWAGLIKGLHVRINTPQAGSMTLFWGHDGSDSFSGSRSMTVAVPTGGGADRTVRFDMSSAAEWDGRLITRLRLDTDFPLSSPFTIDWIRTSDGDYDRDGISDTTEGGGDLDGDGLASFEDPDSDGDGVSDAEETRLGWNALDPLDSNRDSDGDGTSDALESLAGTDPFDSTDKPMPGMAVDDANSTLTMSARTGRRYRLSTSQNLMTWVDGIWSHESDGTPMQWRVPRDPLKTREFYQIGIQGPIQDPVLAGAPVVQIGTSEIPALDNGTLRLEAPTKKGASFSYLAPSGGGNLINIHDQGRLIQQSYYAGDPIDRTADGQSTSWSPWPWNPIQGGDASGKVAPVVEAGVSDFGKGFFSRTIPLLWDMTTGEQAKCWMDQWNEFEPGMENVIRVTCRLVTFRDPADIWVAAKDRHQELPAVYLIRSLSKIVTYQGSNPWTGDATEEFAYVPGPPWQKGNPSEHWVAMVNPTNDIGVGLYSPIGTTLWNIGATGNSTTGGPTSAATMHMAPVRTMRLDRDSIMVYRYWLIHGDLATIRSRAYELHERDPGG